MRSGRNGRPASCWERADLFENYRFWSWLLVVVAAASVGWQVAQWRRGRLPGIRLATGLISRAGFILLGLVYATGAMVTWRQGPVIGLGIVGIGIFLNLSLNVVENFRRARE